MAATASTSPRFTFDDASSPQKKPPTTPTPTGRAYARALRSIRQWNEWTVASSV